MSQRKTVINGVGYYWDGRTWLPDIPGSAGDLVLIKSLERTNRVHRAVFGGAIAGVDSLSVGAILPVLYSTTLNGSPGYQVDCGWINLFVHVLDTELVSQRF